MNKFHQQRADGIENTKQIWEIFDKIDYLLDETKRYLGEDYQHQHLPSNPKSVSRILATPESGSESTEPRYKPGSNSRPKPESGSCFPQRLGKRK